MRAGRLTKLGRRAAPVLVAAAIGIGGSLPAGAVAAQAGSPATDPPVVQSWALAPTGTDPSEPSSRPNLTYEMAPGATTQDSVTLWNYGNTQLTFRTYATDAFNNSEGGFDLLAGDKAPSDVGAWVKLPQDNVTVAARTKVDLPFTLTVPADARAGDHAAAILASSTVDGIGPDGKIVKLDRRTGSRLYLRVAGPLRSDLSVEELNTAYRPGLNPFDGSVDVSYTVRNVGNVRLGAHQLVIMKNPFGRRVKQTAPPDLVEMLPGGSVVMRAHFDHVTASVRLGTTVELTPFPVGQPDSPSTAFSATGHAWAVPWSVIAVSAICVLAWRWLRGRRRRRRSDAPATGWGGDQRELVGVG